MITLRGTTAILIREAVRTLRRGGVIALPTETIYGLACDPRNAKAVAQIFKIKGRSEKKPLQLIAGSREQVTRLAMLTGAANKIATRYWPGPLTLLLPLRPGQKLPARVSPGRVIGIRVSSSAFTKKLALAFGSPIAATSANQTGKEPARSGRGVMRAFATGLQPDLLLDVGALPRRKPSTVARVHDDGRIEVLRAGGIKLKMTHLAKAKRVIKR